MHELAHASERRYRPLRHPVFLAALAVLLINDHVLKGAGLVPAWITGKLSDLAGMIVAPVLLVALLGLRDRHAKAIALAAAALVFSVLEISMSAAAAWDGALSALGIASRSVADPTDLVGLAMLPIAWWLVRERREDSTGGRHALERASLVLAVFACAATSNPRPPVAVWRTGAWIHNRTPAAIDVRLRWPDASLSCDALRDADLGLAIAPDVFGEGITFELEPGETVPIEPAHARAALSTDGAARALERNPCDVVRISIDGIEDRIVSFEMPPIASVPTAIGAETENPPGGIGVIASDAGLTLAIPSEIYRSSILLERAAIPPSSCLEARGEGIAHSDLGALGETEWTVRSRTLLGDGCTELVLGAESAAETMPLFFCVPGDFIPFEPGDTLRAGSGPGGRLDRLDGTSMVLITDAPSVSAYGLVLGLAEVDVSCAERVSCDATIAPARLRRGGGGEEIAIEVPFEIHAERGRRGRGLLARAEHVIVAPSGCEEGRASARTRIDLVLVLSPPGVL